MQIRSVLFVGRRNAARSVMAETCFNAASIHGWRAFSAGWQPQGFIDDLTVQILERHRFPVDALSSKSVDIFRQTGAPRIDICVFMDDRPPADAANYPGQAEYWQLGDPQRARHGKQAYEDSLAAVLARMGELILRGRLSEPDEPYRHAS